MKVNQKHITRFVELTNTAQYDVEKKEEYRRLGLRILYHITEQLGLDQTMYEIRWNPGGIAVSGDHVLHTDKIYLALHDNLGTGWFYWRTCNGRKDYTGGPNRTLPWATLLRDGLTPLINQLKIANGVH